jgi:DNA-binding NtrC family response regulator
MVADKHILIVDDEQSIREIMTDALERQGYRVKTAKDAEEALLCFEQTRFDLALVDMRMPGKMDGLDLLREVHQRWPAVVVIILTAYATMDTAIEAMRDGAYDYLVKPAGISQILESIEHGLERSDKDFNLRRLIANL